MLNEYENNYDDNVGSSNSCVKNRKIVRIKRTARLQRQGKNDTRNTDDDDFIGGPTSTTKEVATDAVTRAFAFDEVDDNKDENNGRQMVRLMWIQKRKAVDEDGKDQEFSRYLNRRKRVKLENDDNVNSYKKVMSCVAGCAFKPDYDLIISWF